MNKRIVEEKIIKIIMMLSTVFVFIILFSIVITILIKGIRSLNFKMLVELPKGGFYIGEEGGILNAIIGSLYLSIGAVITALLLSIPVVLFLNIYLKKSSMFSRYIRFSFDILCGVPSIVYGALGLIIMNIFCIRASLLAGIITLSILIFPLICRGIDEVTRMIPEELVETVYALGSFKFEVSFKIILKKIFPGIITAVLLGFGRAIGDAASVLFTTGYSDYIPESLLQPAASLPLSIFFQFSSPIKSVQNRAFASAFILTVIIFLISVITKIITLKINKDYRK